MTMNITMVNIEFLIFKKNLVDICKTKKRRLKIYSQYKRLKYMKNHLQTLKFKLHTCLIHLHVK